MLIVSKKEPVYTITMSGDEDIDVIIGRNVRRLRELRKMSQQDLVEKTGVPKQSLSGIENGRVGMGKDIMQRMCKALSADPWDFYITDRTPIISDPREREAIEIIRQAGTERVAEDFLRYGHFMVNNAKQESEDAGPRKTPRTPRRKRAG